MTTRNFQSEIDNLLKAANEAGNILLQEFSNGYEVKRLIERIEELNKNINSSYNLEDKFSDPSFKQALIDVTRNLSPDSPIYVFAAANTIKNRVPDLQAFKDGLITCTYRDLSEELGIVSVEKACTNVPLLVSACEHLDNLQAEVGPVPVCTGESAQESIIVP